MYETIYADQEQGTAIGQSYAAMPDEITAGARVAYAVFVQEVREQFAELRTRIRVDFTDEDPYEDFAELSRDVRTNGRLAIWKTQEDQGHPLMCRWDNNRFRAVHDFHGHYSTGRGFDRHGEEAAWFRHSQMFSPVARRAMTTETRGQSSAFIWVNGGKVFPPQKAVLLPLWVSDVRTVKRSS